jgi:DNA-binding CsgD family transcriptional regulator
VVIGAVADGAGVAAAAGDGTTGSGPDAVLVEAWPSGWSLEPLVSWLRVNHPGCRIVGMHRGRRADHEPRASRLGLELVAYGAEPGQLLGALAGHPVARSARPGPDRRRRTTRAQLTEREQQVLRSLAAGRTAKETSLELALSPRTVEHHKRRIYEKLDARNRAHAVALAHRIGLLVPA